MYRMGKRANKEGLNGRFVGNLGWLMAEMGGVVKDEKLE